jgi:hypothetical protein
MPLSPEEIVNKANAIVDAEERGEVWRVTGVSPMSRIRLDARAEHERRTRQSLRRLRGSRKASKSGKSRKSGKARKAGKSGKSRMSRK